MKRTCLLRAWLPGILLALALAGRAGAADDAVLSSKVYRRIKAGVDQVRLIDTHEHIGSEEAYLKRPADALVNLLHYVEADLVSAGMPRDSANNMRAGIQNEAKPFAERWAVFEAHWPDVRFTGYGRALERCVRDLYGLPLDRPTLELGTELNRRIAALHQPGLYRKVLKEKARIDLSIVDIGNAKVDREFFAPVLRFDEFVTAGNRGQFDNLGRKAGVEVRSLEDLVAALEKCFEQGVRDGMVGIKSGLAYGRRIHYPLPTVEEARAAFAKAAAGKGAGPDELLPLHNYMMHQVCRLAAQHKMPFQIHTGLQTGFGNTITNSKPTDLVNLIMTYRDVKFVIFHGGYPYGPELSTIAKNFSNAYVDMCWLHIISPKVAREYLSEWLETVPANKITGFGGDYLYVEGIFAHAEMARENVARVLAGKVLEGYLAEADALPLAVKILRDNALALYRLPIPQAPRPSNAGEAERPK